MQREELLKKILDLEIENRLYDVEINGLKAYSFIRRGFRDKMMGLSGFDLKEANPNVSKKEYRKSVFKSFWHLFKLLISRKKIGTVLHSFSRLELVNGLYVDKFTDPLYNTPDFSYQCISQTIIS